MPCRLTSSLGVKDGAVNFDRAWPPKPPKYDINVKIEGDSLLISTCSGMLCSAWCVSFESDAEVKGCQSCNAVSLDKPKYTICNRRENNFLDGEGTEHKIGL